MMLAAYFCRFPSNIQKLDVNTSENGKLTYVQSVAENLQ